MSSEMSIRQGNVNRNGGGAAAEAPGPSGPGAPLLDEAMNTVESGVSTEGSQHDGSYHDGSRRGSSSHDGSRRGSQQDLSTRGSSSMPGGKASFQPLKSLARRMDALAGLYTEMSSAGEGSVRKAGGVSTPSA